VGANSYTYDNSGNITADGVNTYTWNAEGELGIVKVGGTSVGTYTYNLYRQRAKKVAASTTYYVYGAGGLLYGEYDNSGNFIREYVYLNAAPLAQINSGTPEVLTYLHTDHLGTPRFGTNAAGSQVWAWTNDAFGTSAPTGTATVNLRMAGQYYDSESGLFYNWNRVYNPAIGRYISSDPIGIKGGLNTYGYVGQNPVNSVDPFGLLACVWTTDGAKYCTSSSADLVHYIGGLGQNTITNITIWSHAGPVVQNIGDADDSKDIIFVTNDGVAIIRSANGSNEYLSRLLNGKMQPGSTIDIRGCSANDSSDLPHRPKILTITQAVSLAAGPNVSVIGSSLPTDRTAPDQTVEVPFSQTTYQGGVPQIWYSW
jgi:RHS repeat-associated protein